MRKKEQFSELVETITAIVFIGIGLITFYAGIKILF